MTNLRKYSTMGRAFTLIELMIVLVVIGIIAGVIGFQFLGQAENAKVSATEIQMKTIISALKAYKVKYNVYPPREVGLNALVASKNMDDLPPDSWDMPFDYYSPTAQHEFELISAGSDMKFGTEDDIIMWPETQ